MPRRPSPVRPQEKNNSDVGLHTDIHEEEGAGHSAKPKLQEEG